MKHFALLLLLFLIALPLQAGQKELKNSIISVAAVGDIMMGTTWPEPKLPPQDGQGLFDGVRQHLQGNDIVFGNLEGPLFDGEAEAKCKEPGETCYAFKTPERYVRYLADAGFTALGIANNHANDFGPEGLARTLMVLGQASLHAVGGKAVATLFIGDRRVAVAGFSCSDNPYSYSILDTVAAHRTVSKLKASHDLVIVSFHGGAEGKAAARIPGGMETFLGEDRGDVIAFAHAVVDAGADLVIGHGPHVVRAMEVYKGKLIAYSLGNFLTYERFNIDGPSGRSFILKARLDGANGNFLGGILVPVRLLNEGIPEPDPNRHAVRIVRQLTKQDLPDAGIMIARDGTIEPAKRAGTVSREIAEKKVTAVK